MTITAKVIADSISPENIRLTTLELEYPRWIHPEFMTHRVLSRNASSSRAVPFKRLLRDVRANPATPIHWGVNKAGMQADSELSGWRLRVAKLGWHGAMWATTAIAQILNCVGGHKQWINRLIEPWSHIKVIVTATDWENFMGLRLHEDAQPEIRELACVMKMAMDASTPRKLEPGQWHLPYIDEMDVFDVLDRAGDIWSRAILLAQISAARCARVSYLTHDNKRPTFDQDMQLYARLAGSQPIHASPLEHQGTPDRKTDHARYSSLEMRWQSPGWCRPEQHGNFRGWRQHRKMIVGECFQEKAA